MATLGSRTTAEQALQGQSLQGKKAIVTGANSSLGVETARVLALAGADVTLACRSLEAGQQTAGRLGSMLPSGAGKLTAGKLDLSDLRSVKSFSEEYLASGRALEAIPLAVASLMVVPLAVLTGTANLRTALDGFSTSPVYLIVGAFILATAMVKTRCRRNRGP